MNADKLVAVVMLVSLTFGAGLQVDREHLIAILKNTGLLGRALLANFVIVPILGVLLAKLFRLPPQVATGFLLMAIAPGVPFVLASVRKRGGRLALAVELALFLPLLSIVTVPVTAELVLPAQAVAQLPLGKFVVTLLLFQLLPLLAGIAVGYRAPAIAPRLERVFHYLFIGSVLVLVILYAPKLAEGVAAVYGSNGMWAMLCLCILAMVTGWVLGGPERADRRVLGIGTTLRNIGLAALIATTSFEGTRVAAAVLAYLLIQFVVTAVVGIYFTRTAARSTA
jgi:predicted Na+-dependent transporter